MTARHAWDMLAVILVFLVLLPVWRPAFGGPTTAIAAETRYTGADGVTWLADSERAPLANAPPEIRLHYTALHPPPFPADLRHNFDDSIPPWLFDTVEGARRSDRVVHAVLPKETDPAIETGLGKNIVLFDRSEPADARLLVLLNGAGSDSGILFGDFLNFAADAGYRVIGLNYNSGPPAMRTPAGRLYYADLSPDGRTAPDPHLIAQFRAHLAFGAPLDGAAYGTPSESITNRLVKLLLLLDRRYPDEGWGHYLEGEQPVWDRIVLGGQSNGAAMAAYMAKQVRVARVFLSSGPIDHYDGGPHAKEIAARLNQGDESATQLPGPLAAWLSAPSATPLDRWFGVYHVREPYAAWISLAFNALEVPRGHRRAVSIMRYAMVDPPRSAVEFHGCWFGWSVPIDAHWRPTVEVQGIWSFLLGPPNGG